MILRPLKFYEKLLTGKGRRREMRYLIEGRRQVEQMLESSPAFVEEIISLVNLHELAIPVRVVTPAQMKLFTDSETVPELVALGIIPESCFADSLDQPVSEKILFLEDLQDPGNVGTLLRSAAAFGFHTVLMTDGCADPFAPKVVRSAAGVLPSLQIVRTAAAFDRLKQLKNSGYQLVTAHIDGGLDTLNRSAKTIFALGNEGNGVSNQLLDLSDAIYTIPFDASLVESLNVAIAGSIGMAQSFSKK